MSFPFFDVQVDKDHCFATVYLIRPEKRNLLNWDFWSGLPLVLEQLQNDTGVKVVVLAAHGSDFSLGIDLVDLFQRLAPVLNDKTSVGREQLRQLILTMQRGFRALQQFPKPVVAAVQGWCIGSGLELICACDIRVADASANVSLREVKLAIVADMGGLQLLPRLVGEGNARLMALTGNNYTATEAYRMGLFQQVVENDVLGTAHSIAKEIAQNPSHTLTGVKHVMNHAAQNTFEAGLDYVANWNAAFMDSPDLAESVSAFLEKRKPNYG